MGIYGALASAVSGLRAQSFALENISGNIANSQTTGYKRVETDFVDLVSEGATKRQTAGSVLAQSVVAGPGGWSCSPRPPRYATTSRRPPGSPARWRSRGSRPSPSWVAPSCWC